MKAIAQQQHGAFSRRQALAAGLSSSAIARRLQAGEWKALDDGIYVLKDARPSWLQSVSAACLGTGGLASHLTAGRLWGLALPSPPPAKIDVVVAAARRPRSSRTLQVHRTRADLEAWRTQVQGVPCCELGPTLLQLGEVLGAKALEAAVDSAGLQRSGILFWLADTLVSSRRGHTSSLAFRDLLAELLSDGTLDADVDALLKSAGLAPTFRRHLGLDFVWMPQRVALQTFHHEAHDRWQELEALEAQGFKVLVTHDREVKTRPRALLSRLRVLL
jgi:hypothetical protein